MADNNTPTYTPTELDYDTAIKEEALGILLRLDKGTTRDVIPEGEDQRKFRYEVRAMCGRDGKIVTLVAERAAFGIISSPVTFETQAAAEFAIKTHRGIFEQLFLGAKSGRVPLSRQDYLVQRYLDRKNTEF